MKDKRNDLSYKLNPNTLHFEYKDLQSSSIPDSWFQEFNTYLHFEDGNNTLYHNEYRVGYFVGSSFRVKWCCDKLDEAIVKRNFFNNIHPERKYYVLHHYSISSLIVNISDYE